MKPNIVVALLVGLAVGFAVGKLVSGPPSNAPTPSATIGTIQVPEAPDSEAALAIKSSEMPAGTFTGMTDSQKAAVMKVMNDEICDCGCDKGTLAQCVKNDPNCPNSPAKLKQAVELAKAGKNAAQIRAEMFGSAPAKAVKAPTRPDDTAVYKVAVENAPASGRPYALVTMVEFSDYQCPFCSRANATVEELQKDYGDNLRVVMKQNPLPMHPQAKPAALAALAAGEQGKYWEMHHKLFQNQQALDETSLEKYAKEIGLNVPKWKQAMASQKFQDTIARDQSQASTLGATGTPAFFINGRKLSGAQPKDNFKKIIDEEILKAQAMVKEGARPDQVYAKIMEKASTNPAPAPQNPSPTPAQATVQKVEFPSDSPVKGPKYAKVTIVEWSDFQCPFCSRAIPTLKQIEEKYGKDVRLVFRHQPLPFHPNAQPAAEASMAAHEQGKFWEFHDKLFGNQNALDRPSLEKYAQELGLNASKFKSALDSGKFKARVAADSAAGNAVGANGTPTFFINGRKVVGALPYENFRMIIDDEISKTEKLLASGTKLEKLYDKLMSDAAAAPPPPSAPPPGAAPAPPAAPVENIALDKAPIKGPKDAPVTIVEWSDFQCPFCSRAVPTLKTLEEQYKGKVRVAFKHQPLPFHQNARGAAMAAMAANEQGKFWEYHDKLFANQTALDRPSLEKYAQELGLNMSKFKSALDTNKFESIISADSEEGTKVGARGTPTFFINGRQIVGAQPIENFKSIIDDELQKRGGKKTAKK